MSKKRNYFGEIAHAAKTVAKGMGISGKHLRKGLKPNEPLGIENDGYFEQNQGPITIQYPAARVPVPETGRYRLHMETEDCIGCDKCARICPVDCITIETFRADGDLGKTSDGTVKRLHLPVFDIDMGKCMYCGLCTTVCPTECLIMTKVYDFSEFDRDNLVYHFGAYSPQQEETIREETLVALAKKKAEKAAASGGAKAGSAKAGGAKASPGKRRPMRRKPVTGGQGAQDGKIGEGKGSGVDSAGVEEAGKQVEGATGGGEAKEAPKPRKRPVMRRKPVIKKEEGSGEDEGVETEVKENTPSGVEETGAAPAVEKPKPKKRARPVMKKKPVEAPEESEEGKSKDNQEGGDDA